MCKIYINDLEEYLAENNLFRNADDTALYVSNNSHIDLMLKLRVELECVTAWLIAHHLTANVAKTKYVIFGSQHDRRDLFFLQLEN